MGLEAMSMVGVTAQELSDALLKVPWAPISEKDIFLVEKNPSLNRIEKWKLKRQIRRCLNGSRSSSTLIFNLLRRYEK